MIDTKKNELLKIKEFLKLKLGTSLKDQIFEEYTYKDFTVDIDNKNVTSEINIYWDQELVLSMFCTPTMLKDDNSTFRSQLLFIEKIAEGSAFVLKVESKRLKFFKKDTYLAAIQSGEKFIDLQSDKPVISWKSKYQLTFNQ